MANLGFLVACFHRIGRANQCRYILSSCLLLIALLLNGCADATTFRVLDAETKEPIEGAVALAMWTKTSGLPGLTSSYTAKAVEAVTGADGFFQIPAVLGTLTLQTPHLKVYKAGYVGWDSRYIYLGCYEEDRTLPRKIRREGFSMKNQDILLEHWKEEYTYTSHDRFIQLYTNIQNEAGIIDSKYEKAIRYEVPFYLEERKLLKK